MNEIVPSISRRAFFTGGSALVLATFFEGVFGDISFDEVDKAKFQEKLLKIKDAEGLKKIVEEFEPRQIEVLYKTIAATIANTLTVKLMQDSVFVDSFGIKLRNAGQNDLLEEVQYQIGAGFVANSLIKAPIFEEALFRAVPSLYITKELNDNGLAMWFGIPSSLIFAMLHGLKNRKDEKYFHMRALIGGIFLWYIQRKYGFPAAVLSHSVSNAMFLVYDYLSKELKP